ncbi:hypothetical protein ACFSC3_08115 [Sphingomonas floccifaciens]|uniref:DUF4365 domain-containing protein n=1 Tax=Sphingomonas floccifaciens TaxID=1844115 RepID=A0ABW4NBW3_9SPHN
MSRFLGRSGEKRFSFLCSEAGVTCNPAIEDEHGWDHAVEFPHEPIEGLSADMQIRMPTTFVQTKSHEADGLGVRMKLSNALNLAMSPNPCFVALATIPGDGSDVEWHAVHVWDDLLERILQRARAESAKGFSVLDFRGKWFRFTMRPEDLRDESDLIAWMARTVRTHGPNYAAAKAALVPSPQIVGKISVGPLTSVEELIDHAIGLTDSIPVTGFELNARRFGIDMPLPMPLENGDVFHASMQAHPAATADIRMRGPDGHEIETAADLLMPPDLGLPEESYKYRFRGSFVDIIWSTGGTATINGRLDDAERQHPAELGKTLRFASWAGQGGIDVRVSIDDRLTLGAAATMDPLPGRDDLAYLAELVTALDLASRHLKTVRPEVSIAEVVASVTSVELFHRFVTATDMRLEAVLLPDVPVPVARVAVGYGVVQVGDWCFGAVQKFPVVDRVHDDDRLLLEFGKPILLERYAFHAADVEVPDQLRSDFDRFAKGEGVIMLGDALAALASNDGA